MSEPSLPSVGRTLSGHAAGEDLLLQCADQREGGCLVQTEQLLALGVPQDRSYIDPGFDVFEVNLGHWRTRDMALVKKNGKL
ncbi:hypothetical protein [Spirillospora sp. NPDC048824]|uniref:hypothetical protein n=1 Tax=unclassified Spirillospora TaxID=2642701 RepID=UPI003712BD99